ncbi:S-layer homology domain-containing protein [Saccharibacillus sacchari]|uniref:S-layer homology domain-containing protein n=1 Tax=Saccharibacillus sacchari TaxID=456493 RepID=UPI0004BA677B|nr:S-layer homology domain-containing protein [Saccharibacillus sacchari]
MKKALVVLLALALFMPVQLSLFTSSAYAAQPVSGITDFGNTDDYPANNVDASEPDGYVVPNIVNSGWDFRMFADNDALDAAVNVEAFTGQTVLAYGASNRGLIEVTAIQLSPNDGTLFDLNSVDITFDSGVNEGAKNVELLGYKGGLPVAGATLTKLVYPASYLPPGEGLVSFNVSGVPAFQGVDGFRVLAPPDSVGVYAIGVDNINAINFRNATEAPTYTISVIDDQTLDAVTEGYASGTQDTNTITVNRTGTGTLSNVAANLSGVQASAFELSTLSATTLDAATPSATFTVKAKDGLAVGTYTATVTVSATNMTDEVFTVTQVVTAAPTYTISAIDDQTLDAVTEGYVSGTQDTNTVAVNRTGTGTLSNVAANLSGVQASAFELSPLSVTTLNNTMPSATFTVKAKDGLAVGTYTATVTVTADNLADEVFTVAQVVTEAPTYTISAIDDQTLDAVTEGYASGMQDTNTITVNRTGTGTLLNVAANLSGAQASAFELSPLSATTLNNTMPSATFTVKAKNGLTAGTYTATVTVTADNLADEVFTVTQAVTASPTYTISIIDDQTLDAVTEGYASGTQDTNIITVNRTGTGTLSNVAANLNGVQASAFELSPLSATTLNSTTPSATFTVKAKDGLTVGIYTATVTVTADNLANEVFTVTQVVTAQGQVAAPFASPGGGSVTAGTQVSLTSLTNGAVIHYTLDGSTPTANSPIYSTPITVSAAMTLKAVAVKNDMLTSSIFRASYTIAAPSPQIPSPQTPTPQTPLPQTSTPQTQMPQTPVPQTSTTTGVEVLVNGKIENAGVAAKSERNGQSVTTITVDEQKLQQRLAAEGNEALITIPITATSDVVIGELNGRMIKNMQSTQAVVELRTERAAYTLPARQINMDSISAQIGQNVELQDIKIKIEIATPKVDTMQLVEQSGKKGSFDLVAPAIEFTVRATYGDRTIDVERFNAYVKRTIAIPDGVDPSRITTGVVIDPDGTVRHVPTKVVRIDGKFYAEINSLTNSTYSVVWHPLQFTDAANHWAEEAVNDMGSRMVVNGFEDGTFRPAQDMTRAEFAEIMVRGLGLKLQEGKAPFKDIQENDWYNASILTAFEFGLISGFEDGTFRPQDKITREQAMQIIARAMQLSGLKGKLQATDADVLIVPFADAENVSAWAKNGVVDILNAEIVTGRSGKMLAPKANVTRAEIAVMIRNLLSKSDLI